MTYSDVITMRRKALRQIIAAEGGAYIPSDQNRQPDPALRIWSIQARGLVGIGQTEAKAQSDWFRQAVAVQGVQQ